MTQLAFDFMALDDTGEKYSCGIHRVTRETLAHWEECRQLVCPRCGEESPTPFMAELNHNLIEWRAFCTKQLSLLNHAARCRMILDGQWPHSPQTNCYAGHNHADRKSGSYFSKGAPIECIQAEFDNCYAWLTTHRVDPLIVGRLGIKNHLERAA